VAFQYHREKEFKAEELDSQLQLVNTYILNELYVGHDVSEMRLSEMHPFSDLRISIISNSGVLVYDNTLDRLPGTNHLNRKEIAEAKNKGTGYAVRRHSESTGQTYFYSAKKGDDGSIVRTAVPYSISLGILLRADLGFIWVMGGITVVMCILGFFATRRVGLHISRLNKFARSAEKGERIFDTNPFPHDELGDISNNIVRLYARLQQAYADRDREHSAVLFQQQEKERIKKQLTNNISHELKTPVASIQVCLETLLAHKKLDEAKRQEFLTRCLDNTERLRRLLADVSVITRIDDGGEAINMEQVNIADVISEVVSDCEPMAESKGIAILNETDGPLYVKGNYNLLVSVFRNLIDNAIAYSGGSRVEIMRQYDDNSIVLTVSDNGIGVGQEHISRLFERFYRVDKGRSRAAGGTGLGLAIVKNAVLLHGGTITVRNRASGGLIFTLSFPSLITLN